MEISNYTRDIINTALWLWNILKYNFLAYARVHTHAVHLSDERVLLIKIAFRNINWHVRSKFETCWQQINKMFDELAAQFWLLTYYTKDYLSLRSVVKVQNQTETMIGTICRLTKTKIIIGWPRLALTDQLSFYSQLQAQNIISRYCLLFDAF